MTFAPKSLKKPGAKECKDPFAQSRSILILILVIFGNFFKMKFLYKSKLGFL
jgi:hypothetical protein